MNTQILEKISNDAYTYVTAKCENVSAFVSIQKDGGQVQVIVENASHRAYRGHGKFFASIGKAIENYKSSAMKSLLFAVAAEAV